MKHILEGIPQKGVDWKLYKSLILPDNPVITAVIGIILDKTNNVFLTQNHRGWDLPGGHTEGVESPEETLVREVGEEVGTDIDKDSITLWGYREFNSEEPIPNRDGGYYPTRSHILYYIGRSEGELYDPYGLEIIRSEVVSFQVAIERVNDEVDRYILQDVGTKKK